MTNNIILSQLREKFKGKIEEVLIEERKEYLREQPEILPERKIVMFMLDEIIRAMFISGVSTRKTVKVISNLIGASVSAQFVSQAIEIGEKEIEKWKERYLELKDYLRVRGFFQNELSADKFLYVFFKEKSERYENCSLRYSDIVVNFLSSLENGGVL